LKPKTENKVLPSSFKICLAIGKDAL
jgi:hypothetical protein